MGRHAQRQVVAKCKANAHADADVPRQGRIAFNH